MNICLTCDKETSNNKFCNRSCAAVYNNQNSSASRKFGPSKERTHNCWNCSNRLHAKSLVFILCKHCQTAKDKKDWLEGTYEASTASGSPKTWIRDLLIELFGNQCHVIDCGWSKVHPITGKVPLQLEHIDGNPRNNFKENLMMMCAACHSLTDTYCGLNTAASRTKYGRPLLDRTYARPERMKAIQEGLRDYR